MNRVKIKRVYEKPKPEDGYRMLVDRLWPRGLKKVDADLSEWNKEIPPSTELRVWFGHKPERFEQFSALYKTELKKKMKEISRLKSIAKKENLTLLYAAKDEKINHAIVLMQVLEK